MGRRRKEWVKRHLHEDDWYRNLTEPEAVAWVSAIDEVVAHFKSPKRINRTEHVEIHCELLELDDEMHETTKVRYNANSTDN